MHARVLREQIESNVDPRADEDRQRLNNYYANLEALITQARNRPAANVEAIDRIMELIGQLFDTFIDLPFLAIAFPSNEDNYNIRQEISGPLFQLLWLSRGLRIALAKYFLNQ